QLLMDVILPVLADPSVPDELVGGRLRDQIGMQRLREITSGSWKPLPKDHGRPSELDSSYSYLRQFTPNVLAVIDFQGGPGTAELMEAVAILKEMNRLRHRPAGRRARDRHPRRHADQLRAVRPGRQGPHSQDAGPDARHPGPGRYPDRDCEGLPARRAAAGSPLERGPHRRVLARPAADGRVAEVRAGHGVADRREVVGRGAAEHPGGGAQGAG